VVDVVDPDGQTHRLLLDESLSNGSPAALLRPLVGCGPQIAMGAAARGWLVDLLSALCPKEEFVRVSRTGWVDDDFDTFALADGTVIVRKKAILDRETGIIGEMTQLRGSLGDWQEMQFGWLAGHHRQCPDRADSTPHPLPQTCTNVSWSNPKRPTTSGAGRRGGCCCEMIPSLHPKFTPTWRLLGGALFGDFRWSTFFPLCPVGDDPIHQRRTHQGYVLYGFSEAASGFTRCRVKVLKCCFIRISLIEVYRTSQADDPVNPVLATNYKGDRSSLHLGNQIVICAIKLGHILSLV